MKPISKGRVRQAVQVVFATGLAVAGVQAEAAVNSWLKIPGINGESLDDTHKGEIDVRSYSHTLDSKNCSFAVEKGFDSASPALTEAVAKQSRLASVVLSARKAGEGQKDFLTITLANVTVTSAKAGFSGDDASASEEVTFTPRTATLSYRPQDAKGSLGAAIVTSFSCGNN